MNSNPVPTLTALQDFHLSLISISDWTHQGQGLVDYMQDKDGSTVHCFRGKHLIIDSIYKKTKHLATIFKKNANICWRGCILETKMFWKGSSVRCCCDTLPVHREMPSYHWVHRIHTGQCPVGCDYFIIIQLSICVVGHYMFMFCFIYFTPKSSTVCVIFTITYIFLS